MARLKVVWGQMTPQNVPLQRTTRFAPSPLCQSSFLSEMLSSWFSLKLGWPVNSSSPGLASWMAWYLCSSRYVVNSLAYSGWVIAKAWNSSEKQNLGENVRKVGTDVKLTAGTYWRWWNQKRQRRSPWKAWPCLCLTRPEQNTAGL